MTIIIYGIPNCDSIKKAKKFLENKEIHFEFYNYKKQPVDAQLIQPWLDEFGWEVVLNKRGTTFRKLSENQKQNIDNDKALRLLIENPSMIKRPIITNKQETLVGFKAEQYEDFLKN